MEKHEIVTGVEYAYLIHGVPGPHEPIKALVNDEPDGGYVEVTLYHPDTGQSEERVKTREIVGRWVDEPEARYSQHHAVIEQARANGGSWAWADIAAKRYGDIARQRALADRLTRLGIRRAGRDYAQAGGNSTKKHDTDLQLNYDEIEFLLDRIERGPTAVAPTQVPEPPTEEVTT